MRSLKNPWIMPRVLLLILLLLLGHPANADQVVVRIHQPPPFQLNVSDLYRVDLTNATVQTYTVYLRGSATETQEGLLLEAKSNNFTLPPGFKNVSQSELSPIDVNYSNSSFKDVVVRTGSLPAGDYTICIYAIDAVTGDELGRDCIQHSIAHPSAPALLTPADGTKLEGAYPFFTWMPPMPVPAVPVAYELKIVTLLEHQTPLGAMESNPAWLTEIDIASTTCRYSPSARAFVNGESYAWQITASLEGYPISASEIWTFIYEVASALITRPEAVEMILQQVIKAGNLQQDVLAFLGREPLREGDEVQEDMPGADVVRIKGPTWFAWVNDDPAAEFEHPTRYVFLDAETGRMRVLTRSWWPLVNGSAVWQTREELQGDRFVIFSTIDE